MVPLVRVLLLFACMLSLALAAPGAAGAQQVSVGPTYLVPESQTEAPPGFRLSARQATGVALAAPEVAEAHGEHGLLRTRAFIAGTGRWNVDFYAGTKPVVEVVVDDASARVAHVFTGAAVLDFLARGHLFKLADSPWVWLPLCLLFLAPFFDRRRPFRLLHLDLLALLAFGVSYIWFVRGQIDVSVPLAYPPLLYLLGRMLWAGFRPRRRPEALVPHVPVRLLVIGLVLLVGVRIGLNVANDKVIDVGYAGVVGADRISHGDQLYVDNDVHGDTYGPVNYLVYAPFEKLFPWHGQWDGLPAAHAVAIVFDLLTMLGLFLLGARLRRGPPGRHLGVALAFAWAACPLTLLPLLTNVNDAMISAALVFALLGLASPAKRGLLVALGGAAKFAPLALLPLFAAGRGERRLRSLLVAGGVGVAAVALTFAPFVPDGGLKELWNCTLGYQITRPADFSVWAQHPALGPLQALVSVAAIALAMLVAFLPRRRDAAQVAALAAAVTIAVQLPAKHWFYFYVVWFAPLVLFALFAAYRTEQPTAERDEIESPAFSELTLPA